MIRDKMGTIVTFENQVLSLFHSKIYFTNYDFATIGKAIGLEVPLKSRILTLKKLIDLSTKEQKLEKMYLEFINLIDKRVKEYSKYIESYSYSKDIISPWIDRTDALKSDIRERIEQLN